MQNIKYTHSTERDCNTAAVLTVDSLLPKGDGEVREGHQGKASESPPLSKRVTSFPTFYLVTSLQRRPHQFGQAPSIPLANRPNSHNIPFYCNGPCIGHRNSFKDLSIGTMPYNFAFCLVVIFCNVLCTAKRNFLDEA